jgi:hypothetical protein
MQQFLKKAILKENHGCITAALLNRGMNRSLKARRGLLAIYKIIPLFSNAPLLQAGAKPDAGSLLETVFWGRLDTLQLLFAATPDSAIRQSEGSIMNRGHSLRAYF